METIQIDQRVKLTQDIPELELHCGESGAVCSIWHTPMPAYEVEFEANKRECNVRALLMSYEVLPMRWAHFSLS